MCIASELVGDEVGRSVVGKNSLAEDLLDAFDEDLLEDLLLSGQSTGE